MTPAGRAVFRLAVAAALLLPSIAVAPVARAADPTFGPMQVTVKFETGVTMRQTATLGSDVKRVEAIVREGSGGRAFLATIDFDLSSPTTLGYVYETPSGGTYPNTPLTLGFRITYEDGRTVDGPTKTVLYQDDRFTWKTLAGDVVRVHWYEGNAAFGQRALAIGEEGIKNATSLLGVAETDPIDFFIYADRDAFYDVIGPALPENVGGLAIPPIRTLFANIGPSEVSDPWVAIVVPHELTHVVFDTATKNPYHEPVHWLNEGLADYLAVGYDAGAKANVASAARGGELMPLHALVGQFPSTSFRFSLAYDESVSAIDFMVRTYGRDALVQLIRRYAEGVSDDAAFSGALGVDTAGFEAAWLADLGVAAPIPFGPQPAPPGPVPPGWAAGPAPTPGPGSTPTPTRPQIGDDASGPLVLIGLAILAVLLVAGLLLVARNLGRGEPLLAAGPPPASDRPAPDAPASDGEPGEDAT